MTAEEIRGQLLAARAAAEGIAGRPSLGLRAVEPGGGRWYLCAFDGPAFLCLTGGLRPETSQRCARDAAAAGLLCERLEQYLDAGRLRDLATAVSRVLARGEEGAATVDALARMAQASLDLAGWMDAPERVIASIPQLDDACRRHERLRMSYARFVSATDPLAAAQDTLAADRISALRGVEDAAGEAGLGEGMAHRLGAAMEDCDDAAAQVVAGHITPLHG